MARKEDVFTVANFFEINTLCHWRKCPCVTKTQRYGYIWYIGSCAEPSHKTTVGCEKSANVLKGKWHKNIRKCKNTKNHFSRSDFGSWGGFLGVLGTSLYWKVVSEFWFGQPKCHFRYPKMAKMTPWDWQLFWSHASTYHHVQFLNGFKIFHRPLCIQCL